MTARRFAPVSYTHLDVYKRQDMYTLIEVTADTPERLEVRLSEVERFCSSQDIICKRCDYEEEQAFHSFLPVVSVCLLYTSRCS